MTFEQWLIANRYSLNDDNIVSLKLKFAREKSSKKIPSEIRFSCGSGSAELIEAAADDSDETKPKLRRFKMNAYNGGAMFVGGFFEAVVIDLSGLKVTAKSRPILLNHDPLTPVGHTEKVQVKATRIDIDGVLSVPGQNTDQIIASSDNGFPWQASVGVQIKKAARIDEGEKVTVNGQTFEGPIIVVREGTLSESSFVPLGADDSTQTKVAANAASNPKEMESYMKFNEWLKAQGVDPESLSPEALKAMKAQYDAIQASEEEIKKLKASATPSTVSEDEIQKRIEAAAEKAAEIAYQEAQKSSERKVIAGSHTDLLEQADKEGWTNGELEAKVKLAEILANRQTPNFNLGGNEDSRQEVVEAGMLMSCGVDSAFLVKEYDEKTVEAAHNQYKGIVSLQELIVEAAHRNGYSGGWSFNRDQHGIFAAAFAPNVNAAFSTLSLPGILSNVANKSFKRGFESVESTWRGASAISSVRDFKEITRYTLTGDLNYEKLAPGGKITHGKLGEVAYGNKADTYARMFSIDRTDIINDDLGALSTVPFRIGRGAATKYNQIFWAEFEDNTGGFYAAGNNNETAGVFGIDGVSAQRTAFRKQTDPDGNPLGLMPAKIVVPAELEIEGGKLVKDSTLITGTGDTQTNQNPHAGKFELISSAYLTSAVAYYMIANPLDMPVIESVFLNGKQEPTVESAQADFNSLGIQMRGYHDFGVRKQEFRAGVKSTGV